MNKNYKYLFLALAASLALSCAKDSSLSTGEIAKQYLEAWMNEFYPGLTPEKSGIYILEDTPGDGAAWDSSLGYTYAETTIRFISGEISSTCDENLSKQLGTYAKGNYYGPKFFATGESSSYAGVDAILEGMKVGGTRTAIVPSWLTTTSRYSTQDEYIKKSTGTSTLVYTIKLHGQTKDIGTFQKDSIRNYVNRVFSPSVNPSTFDSSIEKDGTFWFITDSSAFAGKTKFARDTMITMNYTGYLLNGQIFDTTDSKKAKDAGIYDSGKSYSPVTVNYSETYNGIGMNGSDSLIDGFKGALSLMYWVGQKGTAIFISDLGYTNSGSGYIIPPYSPLCFELELL